MVLYLSGVGHRLKANVLMLLVMLLFIGGRDVSLHDVMVIFFTCVVLATVSMHRRNVSRFLSQLASPCSNTCLYQTFN